MIFYKKKEETLCGTYVYKIRYTKWNGKQVMKGRIWQDIPQLDKRLYDEEIRQLQIYAQEEYNLAKYKFMRGDYDYNKDIKKETEE